MQENVKNFQVVLDTQGEISPPAGEWEILVKGGTFSSGGENLSRSDFDHLNVFNAKKTILQILNISKTKISVTCMKLKWKRYRNNDYS